MRIFLIALLAIVTVTSSHAQTNVDKLAATLDSLGTLSFSVWKVSPDLKAPTGGDPSRPDFDDSRWASYNLNERLTFDSCWFRKEIVIPERILGQSVAGPIRIAVSADDYGYCWVNGGAMGHFPWDGEFELTGDAKPGQKISIAIKVINTGGPLRLIRAYAVTKQSEDISRRIKDFALSMRVGQKLLGFDTYQTNARRKQDPGIDKSTVDREEKIRLNALLQKLASEVDVKSLENGSLEKFTASLDGVRSGLKPVSEFAKRYTLFFDANAHIDAAWLWRERETIEVCKNTFTSVLNMMDARPDFTYTQSSAAYYDWMEKLYPEVFRRISPRVREGRWEIIGGMWIEPDCNIPSGESWARQLLYAKRYFREKFGVDVKIGWNPDSFGYNWNMPMFYANAGIDAFVTQKIGWNETNVFPHRAFWWESPDGSRVLSYFPFDYVNTVDDPYRLVDWSRQFDANTGFRKMMILFGVGDHGGGPTDDMIDRIERLKNLDIYPAIEYGTTSQYLGWLKEQDLTTLPVWKDELYLEYHQGTFTTQAESKEWNRKSELLLTNAEKFSSIASSFGRAYNRADLEEAWKHVLFNQFHDILPGSSIREVYVDSPERYLLAEAAGRHELNSSLDYISGKINTAKIDGKPVVVFNPLSWKRSDIVSVDLAEADEENYAVTESGGKEIPSQTVRKDKYHRTVLFRAAEVPSMGYKTYSLLKIKNSPRTDLPASGHSLENEFFKVTIDGATGWLKSVVDKRNRKELLSGPMGNELQMLEDRPAAWDAWNVGLTGVQYPTKLRKIEWVENGPVRKTIRVTSDYLKPGVKKEYPAAEYPNSFFTQDITLYSGIDMIFFNTEVDWWEEKTMLKVAFPVSVKSGSAFYEIPFGSVERSTGWRNSLDSAKVEVPASRWADLSEAGYGISLINNSKYGYDIKGNTMRLSLLRSPVWPDPTADRGKHSIQYALYPHAGSLNDGQTVRRGYEFNAPLIALVSQKQKGKLPRELEFVKISPDNLILTSIKKAEEEEAWIYQWYDASGAGGEAVLALQTPPKKACISDFLEKSGEPLQISGKTVKATTKKHGLVTIKVYF